MILLRILKYFAYGLLSLVLLIALYLGGSWLLTPRAKLVETTPFSGNYWHNPYQNVNLENVFSGNFHAHTDRWGFFTSGRNTREELYDAYKRMGFDVITISDYQSINRFRDTAPDYIPTYERGFNFKKTHQLVIGAKRVLAFDVMLPQTTRMKQHFINRLQTQGELIGLAHPQSWGGGYSDEDLLKLTGYHLFEVLNHFDDWQERAWDLVLSSGKLVWLLANDDSRDVARNWHQVGRRFTRIFAENTNAENIIEALRHGRHYGVAMPVLDGETFEEKAERFRNLPNVTRFEIVDNTLFIQIDEPLREVVLIGDYGVELARFSDENEIIFDLNSLNVTYVRAKIFLPNNVIYYFNPITRTSTP